MLDLRLKLSKKTKANRITEDLEAFESGRWKKFGQVIRVLKGDKVDQCFYQSDRGEEHIYRGREPTLALAFEKGKASWGIDEAVLNFLEASGVTALNFYRKQKLTNFVITIAKFKSLMYRDENPPFQKQVFATFDQFATKTKAVSERSIASSMSL